MSRCVTLQLEELRERYDECAVIVRETQDELKSVRRRGSHVGSVIHQHYGTSAFFMPEGSLALELEKSEQPVPEGYSARDRR